MFVRLAAMAGLACCGVFSVHGQGAKPMMVLQTRYEVRIGDTVEVPAAAETLDFMLHAKTRRMAVDGDNVEGLVVAPNETQDRILLAPSAKAKPGEYSVTLTATGDSGEERQTMVSVVVKPRAGIPVGSTRPPVVLLNGWQAGFTNACPITSDIPTFGNLASFLKQDGVPEVYIFDNCREGASQPIEVLANDLKDFLNSIKYDDGTQVPQIDLVGFSLGGLIARTYLAGLQPNKTYTPPANSLVRKLVLIATPNFGSFVAGNSAAVLTAGSQGAELVPGSAFLWNLATWNQRVDDLGGVDAIAVAGSEGTYTPGVFSFGTPLTNASDGLVSLTSASIGFAAQKPERTRVIPYCHVDPSAFTNTALGTFNCNAPAIARVVEASHPTSLIVRSFLGGTADWNSIGVASSADAYLKNNGGTFFAMQNSAGGYVSDMSQVTWGTVQLQNGGNAGTIFVADFVAGTGKYTATSASLKAIDCGTLAATVGYSAATRCKIGTAIVSVTPLSTTAAVKAVTAGTAITLNGLFGNQCSDCKVTATPAGSTTAQTLTVNSWDNKAIVVQLPASMTGYSTLVVNGAPGNDAIGIMAVSASTIKVDPASLQFAYTLGGAIPGVQSIKITNSDSTALAWTATSTSTWLSLLAASGTTPGTIDVSVPSPALLAAGTYNGTIQITAAGASNSPLSVNVTLTVTAPPAYLVVSPQALSFSYTAGSAGLPAAQDISIGNGGGGDLSWTASSGAYWAVPSAAAGSAPGKVSIAVKPGNLAAGTYTTSVTIGSPDSSITPATVTVTINVNGTPPVGTIVSVANAASYQTSIASATWVAIFGTNLSQFTASWQDSDFVDGALPTSLQGVSVTINGRPAYISYISPTQINVLAPDDSTTGPVPVVVTTAQQASQPFTAQKASIAPAFLTFDGTYVAARHLDYSLLGQPNLLPGATPARPGDTVLLYGVGFGPTNPLLPTEKRVDVAAPLTQDVQITIGGVAATVSFAGLAGSGLYQFNVTVPSLPNGDAAVVAKIAGVETKSGVAIPIQQ